MKQYAAHRVYLAGTEEWCNGPQVVSVSEGKVLSLFPFSGEIPSVEWLGGLLIVAPCLRERMEAESLPHFLKRIPKSNMDSGTASGLWHVTFFDVHAMEFTAASRIIRL